MLLILKFVYLELFCTYQVFRVKTQKYNCLSGKNNNERYVFKPTKAYRLHSV